MARLRLFIAPHLHLTMAHVHVGRSGGRSVGSSVSCRSGGDTSLSFALYIH